MSERQIALDAEGVERAAEAAHVAHHPNWPGAKDAWDDMGGSEPSYERFEWETTARAAIRAYQEAQAVTTVEEVALLPEGTIILDAGGDAFMREDKTNYSANWYQFGTEDGCMASWVLLPARVIYRPIT